MPSAGAPVGYGAGFNSPRLSAGAVCREKMPDRIRHGIRHTAARAGRRPRRRVANGRLRYMLIGYACVSKADGSQSLDLQGDAGLPEESNRLLRPASCFPIAAFVCLLAAAPAASQFLRTKRGVRSRPSAFASPFPSIWRRWAGGRAIWRSGPIGNSPRSSARDRPAGSTSS